MARGNKRLPSHPKKKRGTAAADAKRLRRFLFVWAPVIVITLALVYALSFDPIKAASRTEIVGALEEEQSAGAIGVSVYGVKLADGRSIRVGISEKGAYRMGRRLAISESETLLFRRKVYEFVRFLD